jgi:ferredoxin
VDAIKADTEEGAEKWVDINKKYSELWPNIIIKKNPPEDADNYRDEKDKFKKYFSEKPGKN